MTRPGGRDGAAGGADASRIGSTPTTATRTRAAAADRLARALRPPAARWPSSRTSPGTRDGSSRCCRTTPNSTAASPPSRRTSSRRWPPARPGAGGARRPRPGRSSCCISTSRPTSPSITRRLGAARPIRAVAHHGATRADGDAPQPLTPRAAARADGRGRRPGARFPRPRAPGRRLRLFGTMRCRQAAGNEPPKCGCARRRGRA